jgi:hypothetical protein
LGGDCARVVDVADVLAGRVSPTGSVLVHDELGRPAATSVAELLAARGCAVRSPPRPWSSARTWGPRWTWSCSTGARNRAGIALTTTRVPLAAAGGGRPDGLEHLTGAVTEAHLRLGGATPVPGACGRAVAAPADVEVHRRATAWPPGCPDRGNATGTGSASPCDRRCSGAAISAAALVSALPLVTV